MHFAGHPEMNDSDPSLRELEREAERNRADLMNTVDALQQRISPTAIKHDVQDYVRHKKDNFLQSLEQKARDNPVQTIAIAASAAYPLWGVISRIPIPLMLIGAGLALTRRSAETSESEGSSVIDRSRERLGEATDTLFQKADELSGAAREQIRSLTETAGYAGERVAQYANQARNVAGNIATNLRTQTAESAERARAIGTDAVAAVGETLSAKRVRSAGTQANDWISETVSRNPLAVGVLGLAVGAIVAAALPSTPQENQLLGSASNDLKKKAQEAALGSVAAAKGVAADIYQEATRRAKEEGLSFDDAQKFAGAVGEKIKTAVTNVTGEDRQFEDREDSSGDMFQSQRLTAGGQT